MKITKKQLKRIISEESAKLNRQSAKKAFGSNAEKQKQLQEVEYHGDPVTVAFKNLSSVISGEETGATRADIYMLIDTVGEVVTELQAMIDGMEDRASRGEYR
jgi:hypothetical protein